MKVMATTKHKSGQVSKKPKSKKKER